MSLLKYWEEERKKPKSLAYLLPKKISHSSKQIPEHYRKSVFYSKLWWSMHKRNNNWTCANIGATGSGKSWASIEISDFMDRDKWGDYNFSVDKIAFDVPEFMDILKRVGRYEFVLFDEAGLEVNSRTALSHTNIIMSKINQSFRNKNLGTIYTYPGTMTFIDKQIRSLFKGMMVMLSPGVARYFDLEMKPMSEQLWTVRIQERLDDGDVRVLDPIIVSKPRKELIKAYEEKKAAYLEKTYGEYYSSFSVEKIEREEKGSRFKGKNLVDALLVEIEKNPGLFFDGEKGSFTKKSVYVGVLKNLKEFEKVGVSSLGNVCLFLNTRKEIGQLSV